MADMPKSLSDYSLKTISYMSFSSPAADRKP